MEVERVHSWADHARQIAVTRRAVLLGVLAGMGATTGCLGIDRGGAIMAQIVDEVPDDAEVVNISDPRLDELPLIRTVVNRKVRAGPGHTVTVDGAHDLSRAQANQLKDDLADEFPTQTGSGVYIRKGETIVVVNILFEG